MLRKVKMDAPNSVRLAVRVAEYVPLMRCLWSHFGGHRSGESDSHKTFEFSARKSCVEKRMRLWEFAS